MPTNLPRVAAFDLETCAPPGGDARDANQAIPVQAALLLLHPAGEPPADRRPDAPLLRVADSRHAADDPDLFPFGVDVHTVTGYPSLANPGVPINAEAAEVHGITDEDVADARPEHELCNDLRDQLGLAVVNDYVLVAANAHYDLTVLDRRNRAWHGRDHIGEALGATLTARVRHLHAEPLLVFDPMVIDRHCDKFRRGSRTLTNLAAFYRVPLDQAHDANADALAAGLVLARIFAVAEALADPDAAADRPGANTVFEIADQITTPDRFESIAPMTAAQLHAAQVRWRADWAAGFQTWLRTKAPADRRDPDAVVDGAWPLLPLPEPAA